MKQVAPQETTITGIDIYWRNGVDDFPLEKSKGREFCIHKATEGDSHVDPKFKERWPKIKQAGMLRGAYHFFHPGKSPNEQAKFFARTVLPVLEPTDFVALDWEVSDGTPSQADLAAGLAFLETVKVLTKKRCLIYGGPYFLDALKLDSRFEEYPLWIAEYGVTAPKVPDPYQSWVMWQTGDQGVDFDVFNGSVADMTKLIASL